MVKESVQAVLLGLKMSAKYGCLKLVVLYGCGVFYLCKCSQKKGKEFLFVEHAIENNFLPGDVYAAGICYRISIAEKKLSMKIVIIYIMNQIKIC